MGIDGKEWLTSPPAQSPAEGTCIRIHDVLGMGGVGRSKTLPLWRERETACIGFCVSVFMGGRKWGGGGAKGVGKKNGAKRRTEQL